MSINRVMITGNLTRDSDLRNTNVNGTPVLNFAVAVNDRRKNQTTGEWEDYPNYIDCSLFGARATALEPILKKGLKVAIEGKLRWSQWTDKDNPDKKRSSINVLVDEIEFMSRNGQGGNGGGNSAPAHSAPAHTESAASDEDIPF